MLVKNNFLSLDNNILARSGLLFVIGLFAWKSQYTFPLVALFPFLVPWGKGVFSVFVVSWSYYFGIGILDEFPGAMQYYDLPVWQALLILVMHCMICALPWVLGEVTCPRRYREYLGFVLGVVFTLVPPISWFALANPLFVSGFILPPLGIWTFVFGLMFLVWFSWVMREWKACGVFVLVLCMVVSGVRDVPKNPLWRGVDTYVGGYTGDVENGLRRNQILVSLSRKLFSSHEKVLLFPEGFLGIYRSSILAAVSIVEKDLDEKGKSVLAGGMKIGNDRIGINSVFGFGKNAGGIYHSRITVPVSVFMQNSVREQIDPWRMPVEMVNGEKVFFALCWEAGLLEHMMLFFLSDAQSIAAASNLWMMPLKDFSNALFLQKRALESVALASGVPMTMAVNY